MTLKSQMATSIEDAIAAIQDPDVQDMIKRLSDYGLAVTVPHMHGENGGLLPLPSGTVSVEQNLRVSFTDEDVLDRDGIVPVMWRWNEKTSTISVAGGCGLECRVVTP